MQLNKLRGVKIAMQTVLAASTVVTDISNANPGVLSSVAHGIADGGFGLVTATGMNKVTGRVFRAANGTVDTLELAGANTTNYAAFESGQIEGITFGISLGTTLEISAEGGEPAIDDDTTLHDLTAQESPGLMSAVKFTMTHRWDPTDAALLAMNAASENNNDERAFKITLTSGAVIVFNARVSCSMLPGGDDTKVTTQVTLFATGLPTFYSA